MTLARALPLAAAAAAGAATVFGFAPFGVAFLPVLTLAVLFALWQTATPRAAAAQGFAFGLALFGTGASWVSLSATCSNRRKHVSPAGSSSMRPARGWTESLTG